MSQIALIRLVASYKRNKNFELHLVKTNWDMWVASQVLGELHPKRKYKNSTPSYFLYSKADIGDAIQTLPNDFQTCSQNIKRQNSTKFLHLFFFTKISAVLSYWALTRMTIRADIVSHICTAYQILRNTIDLEKGSSTEDLYILKNHFGLSKKCSLSVSSFLWQREKLNH